MRKRKWLVAAAMTAVLTAHAQPEVLHQINEIKARAAEEHYITEQMMADNADEATIQQCAQSLLQQLSGGYTLNDIRPHLHHIVANRGSRKLVFVYLDKDNLGTPTGTQPMRSSTTTTAKVQLQRDLNTPQQTATAATPATTSTQATARATAVTTTTTTTTSTAATDAAMLQQPFFMQEVMSRRGAMEVEHSLTQMKEQNLIGDFGRLTPDVDLHDCYIIIFRGQEPYAPIGVLTPVLSTGQRHNLRTREDDAIGNHQGCGAFWLKLKK